MKVLQCQSHDHQTLNNKLHIPVQNKVFN